MKRTTRKDITGQRFGRLLVIECVGKNAERKALWRCVCDCGNESTVCGKHLRTGATQSCGCLKHERRLAALERSRTKHGYAKTRVHNIWMGMIDRCTNPKTVGYHIYGGRGISVCERWLDFRNFLADMGEPPEGLTLDRFPNRDGNYEPGNCRWATWIEQENNRRNNRRLMFEGKEYTLAELSRHVGIKQVTFHARLRRGWSVERAATTPMLNSRTKDRTVKVLWEGQTVPLYELADRHGLLRNTVYRRHKLRGWSVERSLGIA